MSWGKLTVISATIMASVLASSCAPQPKFVNPLWESHFGNHFAQFVPPSAANIRESGFRQTFDATYDRVWKAALAIAIQYAAIVRIYRQERFGTLFLLEIDGLYSEKAHRFSNVEFGFAILIEEQKKGTNVYVQAIRPPLQDQTPENMNLAFDQKSSEFLERLSVQLSTGGRWPWLRK